MLSPKLASSMWVGALVPTEELKDTVIYNVYSLRRNQDTALLFFWLFLLCYCIPSLLCLAAVWICPSELTEGQGSWMKFISYKQAMGEMEQIYTSETPQGLSLFQSPLFFDAPQCWEEQVWDKKRNNILNREVNPKLGKGTKFWGNSVSLLASV